MAAKTNAVRILEKSGVDFSLHEYEVDPDNLAAEHVAESIGESSDILFKTLVMEGDKTGYIVGIIPGNSVIDLKKIAKISGNKKVEMIPMKQLLPVTGYIRGGCTAIGMKKRLPVFLDELAKTHSKIYISAGKRGLQIKLDPSDLERVTEAVIADISNKKDE